MKPGEFVLLVFAVVGEVYAIRHFVLKARDQKAQESEWAQRDDEERIERQFAFLVNVPGPGYLPADANPRDLDQHVWRHAKVIAEDRRHPFLEDAPCWHGLGAYL